jgi:hypothetical protein
VPANANAPVFMNVLLLLFIGNCFFVLQIFDALYLRPLYTISYKFNNILFCNNRQGRKASTADNVPGLFNWSGD